MCWAALADRDELLAFGACGRLMRHVYLGNMLFFPLPMVGLARQSIYFTCRLLVMRELHCSMVHTPW